MKFIKFDTAGRPDVLQLGNDKIPRPKEDEVLIKVVAAAVNREDIWQRYGNFVSLNHKTLVLGHECSGTIQEIGSSVHDFRCHEQVCAIVRGGGAYAEYVVVPASSVLHAPKSLSISDAAALPQAICLVTYCFRVLKSVSADKKILIHAAAGGVGVIAIQYAKSIGCKNIFAVVGTDEKMMLCRTLGATECINREKEDFCKRVKDLTGGGVDVILDVNGRDYLEKNLDCLAKGGSLFVIGLKSGCTVDIDFSMLKKKNVEIIGASLMCLRPQMLADLLHQAEAIFWPLIDEGKVKPITKIFFFSDAANAHRAMESKNASGKLLLVPDALEKSMMNADVI